MGSRGPIPKRAAERRRRNKDSVPETAAAPTKVERPPKAGRGSGVGAWRSYAESLGLVVPEELKRDEIVELVDELQDGGGEWHPVAQAWFRSLEQSGQSQFYEPSDWAAARYVAEVMSRNLTASRFSAQLFAGVWTAMSELLTTEGARRRARLEIERETGQEDPETAEVAAIEDYRRTLGA